MPTVSTSIRLPQELYEWLKDKAEKEHRTVSNMMISILLDAKKGEEQERKCYNCKQFGHLNENGNQIDWCMNKNRQGATATLWSCEDWEAKD